MNRSQARRTTGIVVDSVLVAMLVGLLAFPLLPRAAAPDPIPPRPRASSRWPSSWSSASCSRPRRPGRYAREVDPMTRVRAALALEVADRPPAAWWGHTFREEWSARELADVTVARQRAYGWDFVKLQPRACCFAEAFGSEYRPSAEADFAARSVEAGAAGVFFAISGYASADAMSLGEYERLALHHDVRVMGAVPEAAWCNVLHLCGPRVHLDLAPSFERAHAVSWSVHEDGNPALAEGRELAGRAVMGGLDHRGTLVRGRPDDVLREVRSALAITGGKGLLLAPGCSVPPEAPEENLRAISQGPLGSGGR